MGAQTRWGCAEEKLMHDSWTRGPVVIVGASGQVGGALQRRLDDLPIEVRPIGRGDDLTHAARDADSLVHLAGALSPRRPNTFEKANAATARGTARALQGSSVRRVVFLSFPGADPASPNAYLRAKGEAESMLAGTGVPTTVFRCDHIIGPPSEPGPTATSFLARGDHAVAVLGTGRQRWTPLLREDVVEAVVHAALDPAAPTGAFDLAGPDAVTVDDLVDRVNGREVRKRHLHGAAAHVIAALLPSLHAATVEIMADSWVLDGGPTASAFGITRHGLDTLWPRVGAPTSPTATTTTPADAT
jgi:uncharacterized protein YbjT (DUF2867 family)